MRTSGSSMLESLDAARFCYPQLDNGNDCCAAFISGARPGIDVFENASSMEIFESSPFRVA